MAINPSRLATTWRQALALAKLTAAVYSEQWQVEVPNVARDSWNGTPTFSYFEREGAFPRVVLVRYPDTMIVGIEGSTTLDQANKVADGFVNRESFQDGYYFNKFIRECARHINLDLLQPAFNNYANFVAGGHSFGGCIAQALAVGYHQSRQFQTNSACSFGSPMWTDAANCGQIALVPTMRVMNKYDPIPIVWPTYFQAPLMRALASLQPPAGANWQHGGPGWQLWGGSGIVEPKYQPDQLSAIAEIDLVQLLYAHRDGQVNAHSIATYVTNLDWLIRVMFRHDEDDRVTPNSMTVPAPGPAVNARRAAITLELELAERRDFVAQERPQIPKALLFVAKKRGRWWGIQFCGLWICWGMRRRRATHTAFLGNQMFREYLKVGIAYPDSFIGALTFFMNEAVDVSSGIRPTLQADPLILPPPS